MLATLKMLALWFAGMVALVVLALLLGMLWRALGVSSTHMSGMTSLALTAIWVWFGLKLTERFDR